MLPPANMTDAAIQVVEIAELSGKLSAHENDAAEVAAMADKIERMACGLLPIIAAAAGLDMAAKYYVDPERLRVRRFAAVGVVS